MKIQGCLLVLLLLAGTAPAQKKGEKTPAYEKAHLPPFRLIHIPDSIAFTDKTLEKNKQTILFIFSPDCEHCIRVVNDMFTHADLLQNVQLVMATPLSYALTMKFYKEYKIGDYPFIRLGIMNDFILGNYFGMKMYPGIFVYDKKRKFKAGFKGEINWEEVGKVL